MLFTLVFGSLYLNNCLLGYCIDIDCCGFIWLDLLWAVDLLLFNLLCWVICVVCLFMCCFLVCCLSLYSLLVAVWFCFDY